MRGKNWQEASLKAGKAVSYMAVVLIQVRDEEGLKEGRSCGHGEKGTESWDG